jgi:hypothetical protein
MDLSQYLRKAPSQRVETKAKRVEYLIPLEIDERELLGNHFKELLRDPARRSMNYVRVCIVGRDREACMKADLLAQLYRQYAEESPEDLARGLPGPDMNAFVNLPVECQACILHRTSLRSTAGVKGVVSHPKGRIIWGGAFGAITLLWTIGVGQDLGLDPSLTIVAAASLALTAFLGVLGACIWLDSRSSKLTPQAHGPAEVQAPAREELRSRVEATPLDHESVRPEGGPPPPPPPADANTPMADPPLPEATKEAGANPAQALVPEPTPRSIMAVTGPGDEKGDGPEPPPEARPAGTNEALEEGAVEGLTTNELEGPLVDAPAPPPAFTCPVPGCGRSFATQAGLYGHRSAHKGNKSRAKNQKQT